MMQKIRSEACDIFPESDVHTVFGDTYLLIEIMKKTGIWQVISDVFTDTADKTENSLSYSPLPAERRKQNFL